ncbi:MAG: MMPL family transporter [Tissierellia bacterium]|nr:MMPL family transporter [Tissierellia bacterium]
MSEIRGRSISDTQKAEDRITAHFGKQNMLALIVPSGDYDSEKKLLSFLQIYPEVELAVGLSNIEAMSGYNLTDGLTPRQFAELADLDYEIAQILYSAYAVNEENYSKVISGIGQFKVPLIDMYQFLYQEVVLGYVSLDEEVVKELREYNDQMTTARMQMEGEHYSRMLLYLDLPDESPETFEFIGTIYREAHKYYPRDSVFLIGESTNALDLSTTFDNDNLIISILSVVFVIIILTFTFQSAGLPILLISVIQASIWINFSWPYVSNQGVYFLGYLLVSSIQMGANIDYAIIISSRFLDLRKDMPKKEAVIEALNQGFPTVITSGSILAVAGILIGFFSTDGATSVLGTYLGQGTIISVFLVIFVLPQLLYLGDGIIERTSFKLKKMEPFIREKGKVQVQGRLHGYVNGEIDAMVDGTITGDIKPIKNKEDAMDDEQSEEGGQD